MRYASPITRTAVQAITVVCAVVFVIFSIIYLHFYQAEFLGLEQEVLSRGQTVYYPQWGTPLITLLLLGLGLLIRALVSFPIRVQALAWFPSAYLLGVLTCMRFQVGTNEISHIPWGWIVVMAVFYVLALILCRMYPDVRSENETMSTYMFPNMLILFFSFLFTCMIGNSSSSLHFELRAQRMIAEEDYEGVLRGGERSQSFTPRLTAMRAYRISCLNVQIRSFVAMSQVKSTNIWVLVLVPDSASLMLRISLNTFMSMIPFRLPRWLSTFFARIFWTRIWINSPISSCKLMIQ